VPPPSLTLPSVPRSPVPLFPVPFAGRSMTATHRSVTFRRLAAGPPPPSSSMTCVVLGWWWCVVVAGACPPTTSHGPKRAQGDDTVCGFGVDDNWLVSMLLGVPGVCQHVRSTYNSVSRPHRRRCAGTPTRPWLGATPPRLPAQRCVVSQPRNHHLMACGDRGEGSEPLRSYSLLPPPPPPPPRHASLSARPLRRTNVIAFHGTDPAASCVVTSVKDAR